MAEIVNEFSWSFSRQQTFESCLRRYYYRYYVFWNGWRADAPPEARSAYRFSKMMSLPMLIGTAVHETIEEVLRSAQRGHRLEDPVNYLRGRLNQRWLDSKKERWRSQGPKRCPPLYEHYYDLPISKERLARLKDLAISSLENLLASDLYRSMLAAGTENWRSIEALDVLPIGGERAFVSPDFAFDHDGETWILDWKTGAPRDDLEFQLLCYALYARDLWQRPADRLRAFDVFLPEVRLHEVEIDDSRLEETRDRLVERMAVMKSVLADPEANRAEIDQFPGTEDARECEHCFFREMCDVRRDASAKTRERAA